jgi:DNA-directed RNA polymerase subunit RPC12/RpoP
MDQETIATCPKCKKRFLKNVYSGKYCKECGSRLIHHCPNAECNEPIGSLLTEFCRYCGVSYFPYLDK